MALKLPGGWVISRTGQPGTGTAVAPAASPEPEVIQAVIVDEKANVPAQTPAETTRGRKKKEKKPKRPLLLRLFGISPWGAFKLVFLCILIGSVLMLWQEAERVAQENAAAAAGEAARQVWSGAVWAAQNFWQPALYGAAIVAPVWVLWRLLSLPFRS